jgi:hypothetical protein
VLPIGLPPEIDGSYTNLDGTHAGGRRRAKLPGEARPGWKVLRALGSALSLDGFGFTEIDEVRAQMRDALRTPKPAAGAAQGAGRRPHRAHRQHGDLPRRRRAAPLAGAAGASAVAARRRRAAPGGRAARSASAPVAKAKVPRQVVLPVEVATRVPRGAAWIESRARCHGRAAAVRRTGHREGVTTHELDHDATPGRHDLADACDGARRLFLVRDRLPLIIAVALYVWWERKVIGWMHVRMGPNKVGPLGLAQTFADVFKLLLKEVIYPSEREQEAVPARAADRRWSRRSPRGRWCRSARSVVLVRRQRRPAVPAGDDLDGRVRHHPRRLGVELAATRCSARCARRRRRRPTRSRWASRWSACWCWPAA